MGKPKLDGVWRRDREGLWRRRLPKATAVLGVVGLKMYGGKASRTWTIRWCGHDGRHTTSLSGQLHAVTLAEAKAVVEFATQLR